MNAFCVWMKKLHTNLKKQKSNNNSLLLIKLEGVEEGRGDE